MKRKTIEALRGHVVTLEKARVSADPSDGGLIVEADLLVEGHGNERDKHNYTRKFCESLVSAMNGKKCFADHPSISEEEDRPERSVRDVIGYWKNLGIREGEGGKAVVHGQHKIPGGDGFKWVRDLLTEAASYAKEFPGECLVGYSINASGEVGDENEDGWVDILEAEDAVSTDLVTFPGAGGKPQSVKSLESLRESYRRSREAQAFSELQKVVSGLCEEDGKRFENLRHALESVKEVMGEQGKESSTMKKPTKKAKEAVTPAGAHPELNASDAAKIAAEACTSAAGATKDPAMKAKFEAAAAYHSKASEAESESEAEGEGENEIEPGSGDNTDGTTETESEGESEGEAKSKESTRSRDSKKMASLLKENAALKSTLKSSLIEKKIKESGLPTGTHKLIKRELERCDNAKEMDSLIEAKREEYEAVCESGFGTHATVRESRSFGDDDNGGDATDILRETGCIPSASVDDDDEDESEEG